MDIKPGIILNNRYKIEKLIYSGGIGQTYLAFDENNQREVALKILEFEKVTDWKVVELFEREVKSLKSLENDNIPDYFDHFTTKLEGETLFALVQEFVDGKNLKQIIQSGKKYTIKEIEEFLKQLLNILDYIHNLTPPIIHRDINPNNIIIDKNGKIYLVDFGAVGGVVNETYAAAMSNTFVGTIGYMPQEQLFGKTTQSSDLYALGATLIYILTGKDIFEFEMDDEMRINYKPFVNLPDYLERIIDLMIEPNVKKRVNSAASVLDMLKNKHENKYNKMGDIFFNINDSSIKIISSSINNNGQTSEKIFTSDNFKGEDIMDFVKKNFGVDNNSDVKVVFSDNGNPKDMDEAKQMISDFFNQKGFQSSGSINNIFNFDNSNIPRNIYDDKEERKTTRMAILFVLGIMGLIGLIGIIAAYLLR